MPFISLCLSLLRAGGVANAQLDPRRSTAAVMEPADPSPALGQGAGSPSDILLRAAVISAADTSPQVQAEVEPHPKASPAMNSGGIGQSSACARHAVHAASHPADQRPLPVPPADALHLTHPQFAVPPAGLAARWRRTCYHSALARVYRPSAQCQKCDRPGAQGWLYQCTVDREARIMSQKAHGQDVAFDRIGERFIDDMTLGRFGADVRARSPSHFLREISAEQMMSYTPEQLADIIDHRTNVRCIMFACEVSPCLGHKMVVTTGRESYF